MGKVSSNGKSFARAILRSLLKTVSAIILIAIAIITITSVTPIYDFDKASPFQGTDIYNPYRNLDTVVGWKRANFHTHTRVDGLTNECEYWPDEVLKRYEDLGYDIVSFSNHNKLTNHPRGEEFQVDLYEHGYNLFKFHKLAFGADKVWSFDHILPILASQKQYQIERLAKGADIVQLNHPLRTPTLSKSQLELLAGYKLIELDSGKSTENDYWDSALSAGRYSFGVANDDLHFPDRSSKIARRCNFLCTSSAKYDDILRCLNEGCFYSMRLPDYGNGDWAIKGEKSRYVPHIKSIGLKDSVIFVHLSTPAKFIKVIGQNHTTLATYNECDKMQYVVKKSDPYVRITAHFPDGEVIYTNPFARYDSSTSESPFSNNSPQTNILLTALFNLLLLAICVVDGYLFYNYIIKRR
jgi:hypothetical protein